MDYTIKNNMIEVVISDHGAEVQSVKGAHTGEEYMWQADPEIWGRHAPVLFPIVGRLKNDEFAQMRQAYKTRYVSPNRSGLQGQVMSFMTIDTRMEISEFPIVRKMAAPPL